MKENEKACPTPFYLYDEKGIRENGAMLKQVFAWNKGYKEYFAVKATPNPFLLNLLKEMGCGTDCSSMTELMMSKACGFKGHDIMFSSNDTPPEEFAYAEKLGAIINLDDITHIECLEQTLGYIPETISCRFNPGGVFKIGRHGVADGLFVFNQKDASCFVAHGSLLQLADISDNARPRSLRGPVPSVLVVFAFIVAIRPKGALTCA